MNSDPDCFNAVFTNAVNPFSVKAKRYLLHSKYNVNDFLFEPYDFAIIELDQEVDLEDKQILVPNIDFNKYDLSKARNLNPVYAAGYAGSNILKKVRLNWQSASQFYALFYSGSAEKGDSGGPLFYFNNGSVYLLGIAKGSSFQKGVVTIFEPVSNCLDFISANVDLNDLAALNNLPVFNETVSDWKDFECTDGIIIGVVVGAVAGVVVSACVVVVVVIILYNRYYKRTPGPASAT